MFTQAMSRTRGPLPICSLMQPKLIACSAGSTLLRRSNPARAGVGLLGALRESPSQPLPFNTCPDFSEP